MTETLTESYCERCGNRFTFESATRSPGPFSRARTFARGLRNYLTSDESLDEALADARRDLERYASGLQLQAFHDTFSFCFSCRQYTCRDCWNETAGKCRSCAPMVGVPDPLEIRELQAADAERAAQAALADASSPVRIRTVDVQAWPRADVGPAWTEPVPDVLTVSRRGDLPPVSEPTAAPSAAEAPVAPDVSSRPGPEVVASMGAEVSGATPAAAAAAAAGRIAAPQEDVTPEFVASELERLMAEAEAQLAATELETVTVEEVAVEQAETEPVAPMPAAAVVEVTPVAAEPGVAAEQPAVAAELGVAAEPGVAAELESIAVLATVAMPESVEAPGSVEAPEWVTAPEGDQEEPALETEVAPVAIEAEPGALGEQEAVAAPEAQPGETEPAALEREQAALVASEPEERAMEPAPFESIAEEPAAPEPRLFEPAPRVEPAPLAEPAPPPALAPAAPALADTSAGPAPEPPRAAPPAVPTPSRPEPATPLTSPWRIIAPDETPPPLPPTAWPSAPPGRARGAGQQVPTPSSPMGWLLRNRDAQSQVSPRITRSIWDESSREIVARPGSGIQACQQCSLPLSASARFCRRCGARQG